MLYLITPFNRVIALDPATGKQLWFYDPKIDQSLDYGDGLINRGVATWLDPSLTTGKVSFTTFSRLIWERVEWRLPPESLS